SLTQLPPPGSLEERQKRKRQLAAAADSGGEGKDRGRVTEDEVEEFFAILRRLQDAKSPRFVLEDFEGVAGGDDGVGSPLVVDGKASCGGGTDLQIDLDVEPIRNRL
ncbi:hypothetical protein BHE74_00050534, partial [Ensete ventricosum]